MPNHEVVIVIPIYKEYDHLTSDEKISLLQCFKILSKYHICIVHPLSLKIDAYKKNLCIDLGYKLLNKPFDNKYFSNISGYNDFMLSVNFYITFQEYKYILIYQLDCWIFRDELAHWCSLNYDYIGAPIFKNFGTFEEGNKLDVVGNGGLSLRKVDKFIEVLSWKKNIKGFKYYLKKFKQSHKTIDLLRLVVGSLGYHNTVKYLLKFYKQNLVNEDIFFSYNFQTGSNIYLKVPTISLAIDFAFDRSPQYLYQLNQNKLPFGCHGWSRNDNVYLIEDNQFWKQFITN